MTVEDIDTTIPGKTFVACIWFAEKNHTAPSQHMFEIELVKKIVPGSFDLDV